MTEQAKALSEDPFIEKLQEFYYVTLFQQRGSLWPL